MDIAMSPNELLLFRSLLSCSRRYLEFGSGGSTCLAAKQSKEWIITIDSSEEWLKKVAESTTSSATKPETVFVDIGPIGAWGAPIDPSSKVKWPTYHQDVWRRADAANADLYLVDGRFRVSCATQCFIHSSPGTVVAVHDFSDRPQYHILRSLAREVAIAENLSVFITPQSLDRELAHSVLEEHKYNPA